MKFFVFFVFSLTQYSTQTMKRFFEIFQFSTKIDLFIQRWRERFLYSDEWQNMIKTDSKIKSLRVIYIFFSFIQTFATVFFTFAMLFSTAFEADSVNYLRGCFLIFIEYSLCIFDLGWIFRKKTLNLEKTVKKFESELATIVLSTNDFRRIFMDNCMYNAHLIEREANLGLLRASMIKILTFLIFLIQSSVVYKYHNLKNTLHRFNATELVRQMIFQSHAFFGTAFALVNNFKIHFHEKFIALRALSEKEEKNVSLISEFN